MGTAWFCCIAEAERYGRSRTTTRTKGSSLHNLSQIISFARLLDWISILCISIDVVYLVRDIRASVFCLVDAPWFYVSFCCLNHLPSVCFWEFCPLKCMNRTGITIKRIGHAETEGGVRPAYFCWHEWKARGPHKASARLYQTGQSYSHEVEDLSSFCPSAHSSVDLIWSLFATFGLLEYSSVRYISLEVKFQCLETVDIRS